jgi:cytosine/adenosine deaminase-related metal-dependent hydrolase
MRDELSQSQAASVNRQHPGSPASALSSRRELLLAGVAAAAASAVWPQRTCAQGADAADAGLARVQGASRILLKGGVVLTLDPQVGDFAEADVLIEGGRIREIRPNIAASPEAVAVVDAANRIVLPGFIDTHSHSYQGLLRGMLANGLVDPDYNRDVQRALTPAFQAVDAYAGMLATALGMIDAGTTGVVDISQVNHTPEHSDACVRALQESGIRAVYAYSNGSGPAAQYPQDIVRLQRTYFSSKDQLLTLALAVSPDAKLFALAREVGVPAVAHVRNVLPGRNDAERLLELGRAGLLRSGDEYIHCLHLTDAAWRLIKDSGSRVSLSTAIEMTMGHGTPAVQDALDHGVRPSLSSDHGVTLAQDLFAAMRATFTLQRLMVLQRARNGEQNLPPLLTCRDALEFATIEGARCANLNGKVGTLTPGKEADIIMLAADRINVWPLNNAPGAVVNLMNPGHVDTVFIAGKAKKWRGNLVGVDGPRVLRLIEEARDAVVRRAGYRWNVLG